MSFNKIILVGNLGKDPELRYTPAGDAVCDISIATSERKKDKSGEFQDVTTWFRVTLWRKQAENAAKYLSKGRQVYIEGRLGLEEWTDRDGNTRQTLAVQATEMQFIGSRGDGGSGGGGYSDSNQEFAGPASSQSSSGAATSPAAQAPAADDDIPF
jgi:single stranded DNA-binding protein (ssb)